MSTTKELLAQSQKALAEFFGVAKYLFGEDAPLDVNEIPADSPYYEVAKEISDEMGLDWNKMSHEDSNRVMLNLLADYYDAIQVDENYVPVLSISFKKVSGHGVG